MKRLFVLFFALGLLLILSACERNNSLTDSTSHEQLQKLPLEVKFSGRLQIGDMTFVSEAETTFVLPEKFWPFNKWYTYKEMMELGLKAEGLHKSADGPHWYFVLHSGSSLVLQGNCSSTTIFRVIGASFSPTGVMTDVYIDPHTYVDYFYHGTAQHRSYIYDYDEGCNGGFGALQMESPWSNLASNGWNIGQQAYYGEGWQSCNGTLTQMDVILNTCGLITPGSQGAISISQIVFHLTAI